MRNASLRIWIVMCHHLPATGNVRNKRGRWKEGSDLWNDEFCLETRKERSRDALDDLWWYRQWIDECKKSRKLDGVWKKEKKIQTLEKVRTSAGDDPDSDAECNSKDSRGLQCNRLVISARHWFCETRKCENEKGGKKSKESVTRCQKEKNPKRWPSWQILFLVLTRDSDTHD